MNSAKLIALIIALTLFASPALASETTGTITAGSQPQVVSSGGGGGGSIGGQNNNTSGQYDLENLELQITILKLRIQILQVMIQLRHLGRM